MKRRGFLGFLSTAAAAVGLTRVAAPEPTSYAGSVDIYSPEPAGSLLGTEFLGSPSVSVYKYVQANDGLLRGHLVWWKDRKRWLVTSKPGRHLAGVACGDVSKKHYGTIQIYGPATVVTPRLRRPTPKVLRKPVKKRLKVKKLLRRLK